MFGLFQHSKNIFAGEFPQVLVWNPSAENYPKSAQAKNLLYVASTRAEEHLAVVSWGRQSSYLPDPYSKLVRLKEEELAEEQEAISWATQPTFGGGSDDGSNG